MARVSSFTIFVWTTLVLYTLISAGFVSAIQSSSFQNPFNSSTLPQGAFYVYSETQNVTRNGPQVYYTVFSPDRKIVWFTDIFGTHFDVRRPDSWLGWIWFTLSNCPNEAGIIAAYDSTLNYSFFKLDAGASPYQTDMFIYPLYNNVTGFIYNNITESMSHGIVTVLLGSNLTATTMFDISALTGIATGYSGMGAPLEIAVIIGGIWWILVLMGLVKLVVG